MSLDKCALADSYIKNTLRKLTRYHIDIRNLENEIHGYKKSINYLKKTNDSELDNSLTKENIKDLEYKISMRKKDIDLRKEMNDLLSECVDMKKFIKKHYNLFQMQDDPYYFSVNIFENTIKSLNEDNKKFSNKIFNISKNIFKFCVNYFPWTEEELKFCVHYSPHADKKPVVINHLKKISN